MFNEKLLYSITLLDIVKTIRESDMFASSKLQITDLPPWAIKAIDKLCRAFLWRGCKEARGRHCLVAWGIVCRPPDLGGVGVSDLTKLGWALRIRWLWLQKTEPNRPLSALPIHVPDQVRAFFSMAVISEVGNGAHTYFWTDKWIHGQCIADLAPHLFSAIPKRRVQRRTVQEALSHRAWVDDIQGALSVEIIVEYLLLWDLIYGLELQTEFQDSHIWRLAF